MTTHDPEPGGEIPARHVVTLIHPVDDFDSWRDKVLELDRVLGKYIVAREVYQSLDDPNEVLIHCEVQSARAAVKHMAGDLREELDQTGIDIYPPAFAGREVVEMRIARREPPAATDEATEPEAAS
jgi:hypothetical protein